MFKIEGVFSRNRKWIEERLQLDSCYFERLSQGQAPELLYIGCSDSRVTAEEMMGAEPGDVFVHRNIANIVPNDDLSSLSVINFAVRHLEVKHVVVCGHYGCGGVKAAMQVVDMGILNPWLRNIQDVYRLHKEELNPIGDEERRYRRLVELNVSEQCLNVLKTIDMQVAIRERGVQLHGWVFDIQTGEIIDQKIDYRRVVTELANVYAYR